MLTRMQSNEIEMPRLSIITINLNNIDGLKRTIESVINQSIKNFQYIIIDGASSDGSIKVIQSYQKKIDLWISEPDEGIYNAMNKGILHAKGEYCLFLNSGDCLSEINSIEKAFSFNFESDIISFGCKIIKEKSKIIHLPPKEITLYTFIHGSLPHPSTFIKRILLNEMNGYDEEYKILSDWKFFFESLILKNASYSSFDYIISAFDGISGISTDYSKTEEKKAFQILKNKIPERIISDYFIEDRFEHEYFYNIYMSFSKRPTIRLFIFPIVRIIHRLIKGRNNNNRLNRIYFKK